MFVCELELFMNTMFAKFELCAFCGADYTIGSIFGVVYSCTQGERVYEEEPLAVCSSLTFF